MRRYFSNGTSIKDTVKGAGKLTPGGAVVGTLKDIRDRKSILNKKTETKEEKLKRFNKKKLGKRPKRLGDLPKGEPKKLGDLPKGKVYRLNEVPTDRKPYTLDKVPTDRKPIKPLRRLKPEVRDARKYGGRMKLKGGSFPDLNKDGKITKADILMGRGVIKKKKGKK